jgi:uncharacterized protein with NRDE domain
MDFKFSGTPKYVNGKAVFIYKGINLMEYQEQWELFNKVYTKLNFVIGENQQEFWVYLYELNINNTKLTFGASEISNGIWGFALPKE